MHLSNKLRATAAGAVATLALTGVVAALPATPAFSATVLSGPDVSGWNHPNNVAINWTQVRQLGHQSFAIVKATEGTSYTNPWFAKDYAGAKAAGLYRGGYHYARPMLPMSTAVAQADHFANVLGTTRTYGEMPPIMDFEEAGTLTTRDLITWGQTFLAEVQKRTGRVPVIYTYRYFWSTALGGSTAFNRYPLWMADYTVGATAPHTPLVGGWSSWKLWQWTAGDSVPGIVGSNVDDSHFNGDITALRSFASGAASSLSLHAPAAPRAWAYARPYAALVAWDPADNGGALVSSYTVTASPGGQQVTVPGTSTAVNFGKLHPGTHYTFTVQARNSVGAGAVSASSNVVTPYVPVVPTRLTTSRPAVINYGGNAGIAAQLVRSDNGAALAGQTLQLYTAAGGATSYTLARSATTDSRGMVHLTVTPRVTTRYQFRFTRAGYAAASSTTSVAVRPIVRGALSATTVRAGTTVYLRGSVSPVLAGATVVRQGYYSGGWHNWATARVASNGTYAFAIRPSVRTTDYYRVLLPGNANYATAGTPTLALRVV